MKIKIFSLICCIFILLPFPVLAYTALIGTPAQYDDTFLAELSQKHQRLTSIDSKKAVLIGGSSLAFGIDSQLLEEYIGMPVVNYGLYAAIGTKAMLDMSEKYINEGDIVVICPETEAQTYSLYYNAESILQATDGNLSLLLDSGFSNYGKIISALPAFAKSKLSFYKSGNKPGASGIYSKDSFNEYGDIAVERKYNEMPRNYDSSMPIALSTDIIGEGFIDYLNSYAKKMQRRGAEVYFSFSPINKSAIVSTDEEKEEFFKYLGDNLDFPVISDIDSYILDWAYFYDTNFHLNTRGALLRTALLADDILRETGNTEFVETIKYSPPKRPDNYFDAEENGQNDSTDTEYFQYEKTDGGLIISGLTDEGKNQKTLTIPKLSDGKAVIEIGTEAFSESDVLETIIIPSDTRLVTFADRAFAACDSLRRIENNALPSELTASADAFEGMNRSCFVYVPSDNYGVFAGDYFWGGMMQYVKEIE